MGARPVRAAVPIGAEVPSLVRWGLSCDADLIFRTIATFGPRSTSTLAAELGVPAPRVDDALAELLEIGAAVSVTDHRRTARQGPLWATRPPADVGTMLRNRRLRPVDAQLQAPAHHRAGRQLAERGGPSRLLTRPG